MCPSLSHTCSIFSEAPSRLSYLSVLKTNLFSGLSLFIDYYNHSSDYGVLQLKNWNGTYLCNTLRGYLVKNANSFDIAKLSTKILYQFVSFALYWKIYRFCHLKSFGLFYKGNKNQFLISINKLLFIFTLFFPFHYCSHIILFRKDPDSGLYS